MLIFFNESVLMTAFMDNQVQNICEEIDDYQTSIDRDMPQEIWDKFKRQKFMGMIIPKVSIDEKNG